MKRRLYIPSALLILPDLIILLLTIWLTMSYAPLVSDTPFQKYFDINLFYFFSWILISYITERYLSTKMHDYLHASRRLAATSIFVLVLVGSFFLTPYNTGYSIWVIVSYSIMNFLLTTFYYIIRFAVKDAVEINVPEPKESKVSKTVLPTDEHLDEKSTTILINSITDYVGKKAYQFVSSLIDYSRTSNLIFFSYSLLDLSSKPEKFYSTVSIFESLNDIRGINKLFSTANQKLPMNGLLVCNFEQNTSRRKRIYERYPIVINDIIYFFDYLLTRVLPKFYFTSRFYYDITHGKNRVFSKTEILGRLVYCGFEIVKTRKVDGRTYVAARKVKKLHEVLSGKPYGPLIKLRRIGRNGRIIEVFKFRTMFPYSEYLQSYVYTQNRLQDGGKIYKDMRLNYLGKLMRKYWLDELPMLLNLMRGEMKLVGVRPLSQQYFNLYSPELQKKRIRYKPGLLPPFYADMPSTLEEIESSEMKYLTACELKGVWATDLRYFFRILTNILFRRVRSA